MYLCTFSFSVIISAQAEMTDLPFDFDKPEDSPGFLLWQTTIPMQIEDVENLRQRFWQRTEPLKPQIAPSI